MFNFIKTHFSGQVFRLHKDSQLTLSSLESVNIFNEDVEFFGPRTTTFSFSNMAAFGTQSYEILRNVPSPSTQTLLSLRPTWFKMLKKNQANK